MRILVTGGTGFVGQHLALALLKQGHTVRVMGRNFAASQAVLVAGAEQVHADLRDRQAVLAACADVEAVYHVGALSAPWGRTEDFYAINVDGTQHVIDGCLAGKVRRLVAVSSPSVTFTGADVIASDEQAPFPCHAISIYSKTKQLAEARLTAAHAAGLPTVILRPKAIFGPGDTALLPRLIAAAQRGRLPQIGDGNNRVDLTVVDNVVHALVLALEAPAAVGNTYIITNDEHPRLWDVIRHVVARLGLSTDLPQLPIPLALWLARSMELTSSVTGKEPLLTRYSVQILGRHQTYCIDAARRDLGYVPQVSIAEGIERTLAESKAAHPSCQRG